MWLISLDRVTNVVISSVLNWFYTSLLQNNVRRRSATVSSPSLGQLEAAASSNQPSEQPQQEDQQSSNSNSPPNSRGPNFNRTLSFITRMKEANSKRKRKMRQIPISADDIVRPTKCGFIKIGSRGMASFGKRWVFLNLTCSGCSSPYWISHFILKKSKKLMYFQNSIVLCAYWSTSKSALNSYFYKLPF